VKKDKCGTFIYYSIRLYPNAFDSELGAGNSYMKCSRKNILFIFEILCHFFRETRRRFAEPKSNVIALGNSGSTLDKFNVNVRIDYEHDDLSSEEEMIIENPGFVTDRILLLGRKESCVYLLKGRREYALLGGGAAYIVPDVNHQLKKFNIEEKKINRIVILHSHFDHCGIVPFYKKQWPWARISASPRAKELLTKPEVVKNISSLNQLLLGEYGLEKLAGKMGIEFDRIHVDDVVKEGDVLVCDDLSMEVIDVPGHSSCSIAVYVPQEKAMFASDAGGIPFGDQIFTAANSNFDKYLESLQKMAGYDIRIYLAEHYGARTGDDGRHFLKKSMAAAKETRMVLEASYAKTKDIEMSTQEVTDWVLGWMPDGFMPREIISMVVRQMMRFIAGLN
jgi:glyoxylase-like metal-dependent hydrolase (beta-lactamase superfamily II)